MCLDVLHRTHEEETSYNTQVQISHKKSSFSKDLPKKKLIFFLLRFFQQKKTTNPEAFTGVAAGEVPRASSPEMPTP